MQLFTTCYAISHTPDEAAISDTRKSIRTLRSQMEDRTLTGCCKGYR